MRVGKKLSKTGSLGNLPEATQKIYMKNNTTENIENQKLFEEFSKTLKKNPEIGNLFPDTLKMLQEIANFPLLITEKLQLTQKNFDEIFPTVLLEAQETVNLLQAKSIEIFNRFMEEIEKQRLGVVAKVEELRKDALNVDDQESVKALDEIQAIIETKESTFLNLADIFQKLDQIRKAIEKKRQSYPLVKCGLNLEQNLFGMSEKTKEKKFDALDALTKRDFEGHGFFTQPAGLNLSLAEQNALFAIQKCMSDRNYDAIVFYQKENHRPIYYVPVSEYLANYGVTKRKTARGYNEFSSHEREEALKALESLEDKKTFLLWQIPVPDEPDKFEVFGFHERVLTIIRQYGKLSKDELQKLGIDTKKESKAQNLLFIPHRLVFEQIDKYFCLKNADYRKEIKAITGKKNNKYINLFIDKLYEQAAKKQRKNQKLAFEITFDELASQLRMDKEIKERKWKRIKNYISECIEIAKRLEYILECKNEHDQHGKVKFVITLNPKRFYQNR